MFPSESDSTSTKPDVIQATLIFDLPLPPVETPVEIIEEEKPQPVKPKEEPPVIVAPPENQTKPILEPEVQVPPTSPQLITPVPKREEEKTEEPEQSGEIMIMDKKTIQTTDSKISAPASSMAKRHLKSFQQQQRNMVAEQASRYYQQHKNSPVIDAEVKNPFMTEDEKLRDSLKVRADCSSTSKKTTAVILGFLGAQIDCSKPPPINSFIQKRINKQSHLPGQYQQEEQTRPQSVVIKKQP